MKSYAEILGDLYKKYGGNKSSIARKLGNGISSQRLGQYEAGKMEPKQDFIEIWKKAYGDDLTALRSGVERNVSRETTSIPVELWNELKDNNAVFKLELERLWAERERFWSLIDRLTPSAAEVRKPQKG